MTIPSSRSNVGPRPLVSVVVPVYDTENYLRDSIESVVAQTYDRWELLLVDDGSTDGSPGIAQRYAERHTGRVQYLEHPSHENRGTAATRNLGIRHARGEYLAFLDADDIWLPEKLETQLAHLCRHPEAAMTYGPCRWWYSWTGRPEDSSRDYVQNLGVVTGTVIRPPDLLALYLRNGKAVPIPTAVLLRREAVERRGGFEESFRGPIGVYEDQTFYAKMTLGEPALVTDDVLAWYRQRPDGVTAITKRTRSHGRARFAFLTWLEGYLSAQGVTDSEVWTLVRDELWRRRNPRPARYWARARRIGRRLTGLGRRVVEASALALWSERWPR